MESDPRGRRPSPRAVERLARGVTGEVADLRGRLHAALDDADRLEAMGRTDLAVELLEEQRAVLLDVHRRLEQHVVGAAVEAEAEAVLDGAAVAATSSGREQPLDERSERHILRMVTAAVAAVVGVTMLSAAGVPGGGLTIAGVRVVRPSPVATAEPIDSTLPTPAGTPSPSAGDGDAGSGGATAIEDVAELPEAPPAPEDEPAPVAADGPAQDGDEGPDDGTEEPADATALDLPPVPTGDEPTTDDDDAADDDGTEDEAEEPVGSGDEGTEGSPVIADVPEASGGTELDESATPQAPADGREAHEAAL